MSTSGDRALGVGVQRSSRRGSPCAGDLRWVQSLARCRPNGYLPGPSRGRSARGADGLISPVITGSTAPSRERLPAGIQVLVGAGFLVAIGYGIVAPALPLFADSLGVGVTGASL